VLDDFKQTEAFRSRIAPAFIQCFVGFVMHRRHSFAVLFLYHRADTVTLKHLEAFRRGAEGAPVVALTDGGEPIDGSFDVSQIPTHCVTKDKWATVDTVVYRWFAARTLEAERYIIVEWDCLLQGTVKEFYQPVWHESFCGKSIHWLGRGDRWTWFDKSKHLFDPMDNFGAAPLAGVMVDHPALDAITEIVERDERFFNLYCENRIATAAALSGIPLADYPQAARKLTVHRLRHIPVGRGIFHKVKDES
jgi:hypothetical protein